MSDKLTVNLGMRYDYHDAGGREADNRMANFDPAGAGRAGVREGRID